MLIKKIPRQRIRLPNKSGGLFAEYLLRNKLTDTDDVFKFEKKFARYIGTKYAIATPSARVGLYLILNALNIGRNDEVILSSYNSVIIPNILLILGIRPVFVDVDPQTYTMDSKLLQLKIGERTKAIIVTHTEGQPCDLYPILRMSKKYDLKIIEDCAHACGAEYNKKKIGSFGDAAIFSFGTGKHINTLGGGMVVTNDNELVQNIKVQIKTFNSISKFEIFKKLISVKILSLFTDPVIFGFFVYPLIYFFHIFGLDVVTSLFEDRKIIEEFSNRRLTRYSGFQATIGLKELKSLDDNIKKRIENSDYFDKNLSETINRQKKIPRTRPACLNYTIQVKDREKIVKKLLFHGIDVQSTWMDSCSNISFFRKHEKCPISDKLSKEALYIPLYPSLTKREKKHIINVLNKILEI